MKVKDIDPAYSIEVDRIKKDEWPDLLKQFDDANIYQTWSYGAVRWGEKNLSHLVLKRNGDIVAAAQSRIIKIPSIGGGIAYNTWGPLWISQEKEKDFEIYRQMARALIIEYVEKRGLLLRVRPNEIEGLEEGGIARSILNEEGFQWKQSPYRTILLDLEPTLEKLRNNMNRNWRRKLEAAEMLNLKVTQGDEDIIYKALCVPYNEMVKRKKFVPGVSVIEYRAIQKDLPQRLKMNIMVCEFEVRLISSLLVSLIGNKGIFILGGSNEKGLELGASHLLIWRMIRWMKENGARCCDLGGYNPEKNPGTALFKRGLHGKDVRHIGEFEVCQSSVSSFIVRYGERLRNTSENIRPYFRLVKDTIGDRGKVKGSKKRNVLEILEERGFVEQLTGREQIKELLRKPITFYIGFDPTAKSFHVGNLVPIMALANMQRAGHRPIVLLGGGTALVGDPSGKTEMRPIIMRKEIDDNADGLKRQIGRFIDFRDGKAIIVNNADWLSRLRYLDFLKDIGRHFSVNRMLSAECYRARLETDFSFIEFNYMLLQAYDFWYLYNVFDCKLQMGGNDQWGNIVAGVNLAKRLLRANLHGLTFPLITTATGIKMGKTHKGAVWLDPELVSPLEYYKYWLNQDDRDMQRFLGLFTFLPMDDVKRLGYLKGVDKKQVKQVLAYEATKICHGKRAAKAARRAANRLIRR